MKAAVISAYAFSINGKATSSKTVIPCTGTTSYASFQVGEEAHYVCALMNSSPVGVLLRSFSGAGRGFGAPSILGNIAIPKFNPKDRTHQTLAHLSARAHELTVTGKTVELEKVELEVDRVTAELWGITPKELEQIQKGLKET